MSQAGRISVSVKSAPRAIVYALVVGLMLTGIISLSVTPSVGATPSIQVNFGSVTEAHDVAAIGVDESTYGASPDATDSTAQSLFKTLGVGYSMIQLTVNSSGSVICGAVSCNTSITGDTWVKAMKAMGETPVVDIPDTLTTANAAAIVRHFNVTVNDPVKYWEIGDEPDGSESAAAYSAQFNSLSAAMKVVDATIQVGGPATASYNASFLQAFLQSSGSTVNFVDFHFFGTGNSTNTATLLSGLPTFSNDLSSLRSMINSVVPSRASQISIHVGEWNLSASSDPLDVEMFAAVYDADLLGRALVAGDAAQTFGSKAGGEGVLGDGSSGSLGNDVPMPAYRALSMFTGAGLFTHFGTSTVSATSSLAGVDVFASSSPDEIVLVNTNGSVSAATIGITNGASLSAAVWQIKTVATPTKVATLSTTNGTFALSLPADSVTTMVVS
jgi:hypothetical protein